MFGCLLVCFIVFVIQICCMDLRLVYVRVCFRFYKIIFVCKIDETYVEFLTYVFHGERKVKCYYVYFINVHVFHTEEYGQGGKT